MSRRVVVTVDTKTGRLTYDVNGIIGTSCTELTALLTAGQEIEEEHLKEEYGYEVSLPDFIHEEE